MEDQSFIFCERCGKKLIAREPNGLFHFVFGKRKKEDGSLGEFSPVEILVHGSLKMRCLARGCGHWNILNYFPNPIQSAKVEEKLEMRR